MESGAYVSLSEVMDEALRLWRDHRAVEEDPAEVARLRALVEEGIASGPSEFEIIEDILAGAHRLYDARGSPRNLIVIWLDIAPRNRRPADRLVRDLNAASVLLSDNPGLGPERPDLGPTSRVVPVPRYLIVHRRILGSIEILRGVRGARGLPFLWP